MMLYCSPRFEILLRPLCRRRDKTMLLASSLKIQALQNGHLDSLPGIGELPSGLD